MQFGERMGEAVPEIEPGARAKRLAEREPG